MKSNLNAEIIAIGTEILLGEITDTNSVFLARGLRDIGINLYYMTSVGDNEVRIANSIRLALSRADVVITCGGLGPTIDDMTRQGVAVATDRGLTFQQHLLDQIAARFGTFRVQMTENNKRQAYVPDDAIIIENPVGTAPSFVVEVGDKCVISLPGVPREMKFLFTEKVVPYLRERYGLTSEIIKARLLKVAGIGESQLGEMIGTELQEASNPTVGLAAHSGQIDVRITAKATTEFEADQMIGEVEAQLRALIGSYVFGVDKDTIESALVNQLRADASGIAVTEVGIDPVISGRIEKTDGGVGVLLKVEHYDTPDDLAAALKTSAQPIRTLAEQAAKALAAAAQARVAVAVVAFPDINEQADSGEGSALAVVVGDQVRSRVYGFGGESETAKQWTGTWAMSMAWRMLREMNGA
ncbi:MAG: competence/damage-inducible protein A [Chloroflexi bacterium]|uniref:competence/damage-inducible protein A n=1 Tax=Candidatus Flexifilum breve TaxID=3140694 RepID=UPI00313723EA|nr:competence/damage-inducible protein A [Chloroflexota bacterium]